LLCFFDLVAFGGMAVSMLQIRRRTGKLANSGTARVLEHRQFVHCRETGFLHSVGKLENWRTQARQGFWSIGSLSIVGKLENWRTQTQQGFWSIGCLLIVGKLENWQSVGKLENWFSGKLPIFGKLDFWNCRETGKLDFWQTDMWH
jgi:hypothetical protein